MIEVSLGSSWPKDSLRMEASGFPEPVGPEIQKNGKTFLTSTSSIQRKKFYKSCQALNTTKQNFNYSITKWLCSSNNIRCRSIQLYFKMEMNIRLKQNLGKLFVWRKFFNLKGKQKWGHQILYDKLSSTRTLLIIDTMAPRSHGPSRWRSPQGDSSEQIKKILMFLF